MQSIVVPGWPEVIIFFVLINVFIKVLLPAFGFPMIDILLK